MNINISDTNKFVWWNIGASGTRTTAGLLTSYYDMYVKNTNSGGVVETFTHEYYTPYEDYTIICSVRNPYSWVVKEFDDRVKDGTVEDDFEKYVGEYIDVSPICQQVEAWERSGNFPDYYIKMEDIYSSFMEIPILANKMNDEIKEKLELWDSWRKWKPYYNQKIANKVYNYPYMKKLFKLTGYNKDDWQ